MAEVYIIENKVNGKKYVGKTTRNAAHRFHAHVADARGGSNLYFHRAIRKHGPENFFIAARIVVPAEFLNTVERLWIARLGTANRRKGYNSTTGGDGGMQFTSEVCDKISAKVKAAMTPEIRAKIGAASRNRSAATRIKLSIAASKPRPHARKSKSEIHKDKIRISMLGTHNALGIRWKHTPESIAKMKAAQRWDLQLVRRATHTETRKPGTPDVPA